MTASKDRRFTRYVAFGALIDGVPSVQVLATVTSEVKQSMKIYCVNGAWAGTYYPSTDDQKRGLLRPDGRHDPAETTLLFDGLLPDGLGGYNEKILYIEQHWPELTKSSSELIKVRSDNS